LDLLPGLTARPWQRLILLGACLTLSSCFLRPHHIDIQQGNYIDTGAIEKLKPGMTRSQVRFLLGTPLLTDAFHPDRWDYLYIDRPKGRLRQEHRLTLWFEGDQLKRAVTDAPAAAPTADTAPAGKQSSARAP
jgi:outer membrane protein assembly factor BamE